MEKSSVIFLTLLFLAVSQKLPSDFKICDHFGPDLNDCLRDAIMSAIRQLQNGLPEIEAAPLNPVVISNMTVKFSDHVMNFSDVHVYNVSDGVIEKIDASATSDKFDIEIFVSVKEILTIMNYDIKGKLLLFAIDGSGRATVRFNNITFDMIINSTVVETRGVSHYRVKEFSLKLIPKLVIFNLENIFPGNSELNDQFNKALNDHWEVLFNETQPQFEKMIAEFFANYINNVFKYVPVFHK